MCTKKFLLSLFLALGTLSVGWAQVLIEPDGETLLLASEVYEVGNGKFYDELPHQAANINYNEGADALIDWKNGDYATWYIAVMEPGTYKVSVLYSKQGAFDKDPLDMKFFVDDELAITSGLYYDEAFENSGAWDVFALKELGTIDLTFDNMSVTLTNDGSVNNPLGPTGTTGVTEDGPCGNGLNYYRIRHIVLEPASGTSIQMPIVDATVAYPNPTNGLFTLNFGKEGNRSVSLITLTGQLLLSKTVSNKTAQMDISSFPKGAYLLVVADSEQKQTLKIMKMQ